VQRVCARSDPPRCIASPSRFTAYLRTPTDGASRAGSLNGLDRTEHGRPLPSPTGSAPTIPRHTPEDLEHDRIKGVPLRLRAVLAGTGREGRHHWRHVFASTAPLAPSGGTVTPSSLLPTSPYAIGRWPECPRRCSQTKWRPGGRRARRDRQRNVTIFGSARAVRINHTRAPEDAAPSGRAPPPSRSESRCGRGWHPQMQLCGHR
jgi:hypothetical protein